MIGWHQLFQGRMASSWAKAQDRYIRTLPPKLAKNKSGSQWSLAITLEIWAWFGVYWEERNTIVHGKEQSAKRVKIKERLTREITALYAVRNQVKACDRGIFSDSVEEHTQRRNVRALLEIGSPHGGQ